MGVGGAEFLRTIRSSFLDVPSLRSPEMSEGRGVTSVNHALRGGDRNGDINSGEGSGGPVQA